MHVRKREFSHHIRILEITVAFQWRKEEWTGSFDVIMWRYSTSLSPCHCSRKSQDLRNTCWGAMALTVLSHWCESSCLAAPSASRVITLVLQFSSYQHPRTVFEGDFHSGCIETNIKLKQNTYSKSSPWLLWLENMFTFVSTISIDT